VRRTMAMIDDNAATVVQGRHQVGVGCALVTVKCPWGSFRGSDQIISLNFPVSDVPYITG
jgi:hypothetical protein